MSNSPLPEPGIALVTYRANPGPSQSDALLVAPLAARGYHAEAVPWDAPGVEWARYAAVVLRSCWDYHHRPEEFRQWIMALPAQGARLWNPVPVVLWNLDKGYLRDLSAAGVATIPTYWAEFGQAPPLAAILKEQKWEAAMIKPRIGASAFGAWSAGLAEASDQQAHFAAQLSQGPLMVQRFMPEIAAGEWSLVFFQGRFSHAVLKRPAAGGVFVQARHGGSSAPAAPSPALQAQAQAALVAAADCCQRPVSDLLYARVDGLDVNGTLTIMEVELLEPGLLLQPEAADRFAAAIARVAAPA